MASVGAAVVVVAMLAGASPGSPAPAPAPAPAAAATATATLPQLSLDAALAELDRQSLTLKQARERAREASAVTLQATSPLVPAVTASGTYLRNRDEFAIRLPASAGPGIGLPPGGVTIQPLEQLSGTLAVRVPLVIPQAWFERSQALGVARAASARAEAVRLQLRAGFAQAVHAALASEEVVDAAERALANAAELTRSAERRVAAGTSAPLDVLRSRTEEVARRSDLVRARADVERARLSLGVLLGREGPVRVVVAAEPSLLAPGTTEVEALARDALARRPELAVQRAQVEAAEAGTRAAWARLAPQLSATGAAFVADVPYPTGKYDGWRVTLDLIWPLWDGGLQLGRRRQAEAQASFARAAAEAERLAVVEEVHDTSRDLAVAREQLELAAQRRDLAAESAASARRSFDAGVASTLDVIDANDRLFAADIRAASARAGLAQAAIALDRAVGRAPGEPVR